MELSKQLTEFLEKENKKRDTPEQKAERLKHKQQFIDDLNASYKKVVELIEKNQKNANPS